MPGLYLAGGSTHPGPGVPMAALSGRLAASSLLHGPRFDRAVPPGGYAWWYVDALSDDGAARPHHHRLHRQRVLALLRVGAAQRPAPIRSIIARSTSRSMARRKRWAMTERGAAAVAARRRRARDRPERAGLGRQRADDRHRRGHRAAAAPHPRPGAPDPARARRASTVRARCRRPAPLVADRAERRVEVDARAPGAALAGRRLSRHQRGRRAAGATPSRRWHWSRAQSARRHGGALRRRRRATARAPSLALRFDPRGGVHPFESPAAAPRLPRTGWRIARATRSERRRRTVAPHAGRHAVLRAVAVSPRLLGEPATAMHESLSLDRFRAQWCRRCCRSACRGARAGPEPGALRSGFLVLRLVGSLSGRLALAIAPQLAGHRNQLPDAEPDGEPEDQGQLDQLGGVGSMAQAS